LLLVFGFSFSIFWAWSSRSLLRPPLFFF
jgi:hypothetical protein